MSYLDISRLPGPLGIQVEAELQSGGSGDLKFDRTEWRDSDGDRRRPGRDQPQIRPG